MHSDPYTRSERPPSSPPPLPPAAPPWLPPAMPGPGMVTADDRTTAMLCHLLAIFTGFLGPLILWLVKKDSSAFVDHHGRESLNFQLTGLIAMLVLGGLTVVLMFVFIGILLIPLWFVLPVLMIVAEIMACVAANNGGWHRYPCTIRFF